MKRFTIILLVSIILLGIIFVFYPIKTCKAVILSVDKSGGMEYSSIQWAINNASAGDTVYVYSGTYYENLVINKSIILTGENKQTTIIAGSIEDDIIKITSDNVQISSFTIQNPLGNDMKCLKLNKVEGCTISENIIKNGDDGIYLIYSDNNVINENTIEGQKSNGIYATGSNNNQFYQNIIRDNSVSGIRLINSNNNLLYLNDLSGNLNSNAHDNGNNNWNNDSKGNYWDDYNNYDNNNDGIGDTPYSIPGGLNKDNKPLGYFLLKAYIHSVSPNPAIVGQTISFQGFSTGYGNIIQWEWKAGSYIVGNQEDCQYSGLPTGTYTVTFRIKDIKGTWSEATYEQTLVVNPASNNNQENHQPIAHITTITPLSSTYGETIFFQGYGQDEEDGSTSTFYWSSNRDGQIGSNSSFYKSDLSVGIHTITLKVRDSDGMWSEPVNKTLTILADSSNKDNINPVADAGGPYNGFTNESISFIGSNSFDNDGIITSYRWNFGDGSTGSGSTTNHIYLKPGTYSINLTVTDNNSSTNTGTTTVTVQSREENNSNNSNNNTKGKWVIPGFEAIPIFIIIFIIIVIKKTKKKK